MSIDTSKTVVKSFKNFFLGAFFSRITGLLRDVLIAFVFGASIEIALFMVAFRFSNLFRRLLGDASLQASFIPYFEHIKKDDEKRAYLFFKDLFFTIFFVAFFVVIATHIVLFFLKSSSIDLKILNHLKIMIFGLVFISIFALNQAFLQSHNIYFLPSFSSVFFNLTTILALILFKYLPLDKLAYVLSFSVVLAFFLQYLTTAISSFKILLKKISLKELFKIHFFSKDIKLLFTPIIFSIIGISAVQINSALDGVFALYVDKKASAYLWYAIRFYQLPLALFGIAISSAILPPLCRAFKALDFESFNNFLSLAFKKSFSLLLPATFFLLLTAPHIINLTFSYGAFDFLAIANTSYCLYGYSIGLCFAVFTMILTQSFYAKKSYFFPMVASVLSVLLNVALNAIFIFIFDMKAISIALATSISSLFNFLILYLFLKRKVSKEISLEKNSFICFYKVFKASFFAFVITLAFGVFFEDSSVQFFLFKDMNFERSFVDKFLSFFKLSTVFGSSLIAFSYLFKVDDILSIFKISLKTSQNKTIN